MTKKPKAPQTAVAAPAPAEPPRRMVVAGEQVRPLQLNTFADMWQFAGALAKSGMLPNSYKDKGNPTEEQLRAKAMVALQLGAEVGLQPMQAIQGIYVVNGLPTLWGDAMLAVVRNSGLLVKIEETINQDDTTNPTAICKVWRKGIDDPIERSFSLKAAQQAGLMEKDTYKKYPTRMLPMRARSYALRDMFSDVLKGLTHTYEEMVDVTPDEAAAPAAKPTGQSMDEMVTAEAAAAAPAATEAPAPGEELVDVTPAAAEPERRTE